MGILISMKILFFAAMMFVPMAVNAAVLTSEEAIKIRKGWDEVGFHKDHCSSTEDYIKTLEFLRKETVAYIPEKQARQVAHLVATGCTGASDKFIKAFVTLKRSGVSLQKTVDVALVLSKADPVTVTNFYEVFKKMYLTEFLNLDFKTTFEATLDLSLNYQGNLEFALQDFNKMSEFCLDSKSLGLSVSQCTQMALKIAKLSQYYRKGVYESFQEVYKTLREDKKFGLSVKEALISSEQILKNGPMAVPNFIKAFEYATNPKGLGLKGPEAVQFAMKMADLSHKGKEAPLYPGDQLVPAGY